MKIKTDFVTNSSSTNFILITKKEITSANDLAEVLGVKKDSPIYSYIEDFCTEIFSYINPSYFDINNVEQEKEFIKEEFGSKTFKKYEKLSKKGFHTYISRAGTDYNELMTFFAMDYFEFNKKDIFIDGRKNVY